MNMYQFLAYNQPLSKDRLEKILNIIASGESVTLASLHRSYRTQFASSLLEKKDFNIMLKGRLADFLFIPVDLSLNQEFLEKQLEEFLSAQSEIKGISNKIREIINSGKRISFVVDNFNFRNPDLLKYLLNLKLLSPEKIKFVFLSLANDFYNEKVHETGFESIYHHIIQVPYLTKEETVDWINMMCEMHNVKFSEKEKDEIYAFSGGIPGLTRHFCRIRDQYTNASDAINGPEILGITQNYWERFTEKEKNVLMSCVLGNPQSDTKEFEYMKDLRLIDSEGKIIGTWIELILKNKKAIEKVLQVKNDTIYWSGINLNDTLTKTEKKVMLCLIENKDNLVKRDDLANVIWGENGSSSISDYAIDQAVSRLRRKLDEIGLGGEIIKTAKGEGFTLTGVEVV